MEAGKLIGSSPMKMKTDDEEQKCVDQRKRNEDKDLPDECPESKKMKSEDFDDGLLSESDVDLGEGSISYYPSSDYEEEIDESVGDAKFAMSFLSDDDLAIVRLPTVQVPKEKLSWRRRFMLYRSRDDEALYEHVIQKSDDFEVPFFPDSTYDFGERNPIPYWRLHGSKSKKDVSMSEEYVGYCKEAIDEYNKKKGTHYEFKYLIKVVTSMYERNLTFALTNPGDRPYVGRVKGVKDNGVQSPIVIREMRVTRGEYRAPRWKDTKGNEYICIVNEEYREMLPELEKKWQQMHPNREMRPHVPRIKKKPYYEGMFA